MSSLINQCNDNTFVNFRTTSPWWENAWTLGNCGRLRTSNISLLGSDQPFSGSCFSCRRQRSWRSGSCHLLFWWRTSQGGDWVAETSWDLRRDGVGAGHGGGGEGQVWCQPGELPQLSIQKCGQQKNFLRITGRDWRLLVPGRPRQPGRRWRLLQPGGPFRAGLWSRLLRCLPVSVFPFWGVGRSMCRRPAAHQARTTHLSQSQRPEWVLEPASREGCSCGSQAYENCDIAGVCKDVWLLLLPFWGSHHRSSSGFHRGHTWSHIYHSRHWTRNPFLQPGKGFPGKKLDSISDTKDVLEKTLSRNGISTSKGRGCALTLCCCI